MMNSESKIESMELMSEMLYLQNKLEQTKFQLLNVLTISAYKEYDKATIEDTNNFVDSINNKNNDLVIEFTPCPHVKQKYRYKDIKVNLHSDNKAALFISLIKECKEKKLI